MVKITTIKKITALAALMTLGTGALAQGPMAGTHRLPTLPATPSVPRAVPPGGTTGKKTRGVITLTHVLDPKTGKPTGQMIQHGGSAGRGGRVMQSHETDVRSPNRAIKPGDRGDNMFIGKDGKGRPTTLTLTRNAGGFLTGQVQEHRGKPGVAPKNYALGRRDSKTGKKTPVKTLPSPEHHS